MRKTRGDSFIVLLCCVLAMPTVAVIMGYLPPYFEKDLFLPWIAAGAVLGVAHIVLRPLLRLITLPLGCITFGLSGTVIDVALIYLSARFVRGFAVPGIGYAVLTALLVNVISAISGGRRR